MAWTNSGYDSESTVAAKLAMARAYKKEILDAMQDPQSASADGQSMSRFDLQSLLQTVMADIEKYERKSAAASPVSRVRFRRPR